VVQRGGEIRAGGGLCGAGAAAAEDSRCRAVPPSTGCPGGSHFANGLDFRCCEVAGEVLPDFDRLATLKTGTVTGFDPGVAVREQHIGLQFTGWFEAAQSGLYTFWLKSDDGSRLSIGSPSVRAEAIGQAEFPAPRRIAIGQTLHEDEEGQWAELEGKVTFVREQPDSLLLELSAGAGRVRVKVADPVGIPADTLLNNRIHATGFCQSAQTIDGQKVPASCSSRETRDSIDRNTIAP